MYAGTRKVIDGVTCNATATVYSLVPEDDLTQATNSWIRVGAGESFAVWVYGVSATGTVNVNVYADISPLSTSIAYASSDATKYVTVTLTSSAIAADPTLYRYTPSDFDYPFAKMRLRVVGSGSNPTDSVIHAWVTSAK